MKKTLLAAIALSGIAGIVAINSMSSQMVVTYDHPTISNPVVSSQESPQKIDITAVSDASSEVDGKWLGLCKKHSVDSIADFRNTVMGDPVLVQEYQTFRWSQARVGELQEDTPAYVTHRQGSTVLPSSKAITLPKGDRYITDGVITVRLYCCNSYQHFETFDQTPVAVVPPIETDYSQLYPVTLPASFYGGGSGWYSGGPGIYHSTIYGNVSSNIVDGDDVGNDDTGGNTSPVPEPSTMLLFGAGLVGLGLFRKRNI